ncbi:hypothetical protein [uncultured Microbacterium sp.]|jgi:hypothetical protein|uniref:hypothetical protein n=1 Tax=Microbacterium algeriense TaxID=2615184 RepID=UPI002598016A|nr:hypothetical protein [uncultured Microbacterium sp.]
MGGTLTKVELGHGRGWAAPDAARSIARIDAQLGRPADINEAGRSPEQANANRARWLAYERYLKGGPWAPKAPYALGADQSVHCWGGAADSDDWHDPAAAAVWRDNGWKQTARYFDRNGRPTAKDEPWHGEYFPELDKHRHVTVALINDNGVWRLPSSAATPSHIEPVRRDIMSIPVLAMTGGPGDTRVFEISGGSKRHIIHRAELNALQAIAGQLDPHGRPGDKALQDHIAVIGNLASIPNRVDAVTVEQVEAILRRAGVGVGATIDIEAIANAVNDEAARRLKS